MTTTPTEEPPRYVTVAIGNRWAVGHLLTASGGWWVDVKRSGLCLEDAQDLRDAWNTRGTDKR